MQITSRGAWQLFKKTLQLFTYKSALFMKNTVKKKVTVNVVTFIFISFRYVTFLFTIYLSIGSFIVKFIDLFSFIFLRSINDN